MTFGEIEGIVPGLSRVSCVGRSVGGSTKIPGSEVRSRRSGVTGATTLMACTEMIAAGRSSAIRS